MTQPLTLARAVDCLGGLPVEDARGCEFLRSGDVARWIAEVTGHGFAVVIAPEGWNPPAPPAGPSGYRMTLLCPSRADYARIMLLRGGRPC